MGFWMRMVALTLVLAGPCWAAGASECPPVARLTPELFKDAAANPQDRGPLWRISRDGHSSYLYGTLHVGKAPWLAPGPLLGQALRDTDVLALELDPLDEDLQREMMTALAGRPAQALEAGLAARLGRLWQDQCLPAPALEQMPVELQLATLAVLGGRRHGFDVAYGTEVMLSLLARNTGRRVVSLETVALQVSALLVPDAAERLAMVRDSLDDLESAKVKAILLKTARVWEEADLGELERYAQWCECATTDTEKKMMQRLLGDRNPGLARRIDELHTGGSRALAAVGSLHMAGPEGIPALLAARGYAIERLR